jgi:peptidyl-prolyl cis-trans isomerase SurA
MNTNIRAIILCLLFVVSATAQKKGKVLIKVDGEPSYQAEFVGLFAKNRGIDSDNSKESLEKDLQLFIDYKLKLIEASKLGLDTVTEYKEEVKRYRNQLALPYLTDNKYIDGLVKKVYERSLKEVKASHILILVDENEKDTIKAYEKITALRNKAINGADFGVLAQENSEDRSAKQNKGDLGYFSVFRMVHQFEDAAFSTPVGTVSKIFRTRFGFHILKVEDIRDSKGEVEVAHIMIRDTTSVGKATIDKVEQEVINGGVCEQLAEKYSDDRRTATNGGKMPKFTMGSMPAPFDTESFLLSKENPYSKPFRTDYGWHFVKFINHYPVPSFES